MTEIKFFTLDKRKEELIRRYGSYLKNSPDCEDAQEALKEVRRQLDSFERTLTDGLAQRIAASRGEIERLAKDISEIASMIRLSKSSLPREDESKINEVLKSLSALEERINTLLRALEESRNLETTKKLLSIFKDLPGEAFYLRLIADGVLAEQLRLKEQVEGICDKLVKLLDYYSVQIDLEFYRKLKDLEKIIMEIIAYGEDYVKLRELARANQFYRRIYYDFSADIFDEVIYNSEAFSFLRQAVELLAVGPADLADAYSCLRMLTKKFDIRGEDHHNVVPALAYVLFHLSKRVNLEELLEELESYVRAELANIYKSKDKEEKERLFTKFYYRLTKILYLVLCQEGCANWRLAVTLGISAARFWSRWNDEPLFIELCHGLRMLCRFATQDEAERVLTYATLFSDFDFIVKLGSLLQACGSLRSINPFS